MNTCSPRVLHFSHRHIQIPLDQRSTSRFVKNYSSALTCSVSEIFLRLISSFSLLFPRSRRLVQSYAGINGEKPNPSCVVLCEVSMAQVPIAPRKTIDFKWYLCNGNARESINFYDTTRLDTRRVCICYLRRKTEGRMSSGITRFAISVRGGSFIRALPAPGSVHENFTHLHIFTGVLSCRASP